MSRNRFYGKCSAKRRYKLLKIYDGKSIEASQIQFKAEVATPDSNRIDSIVQKSRYLKVEN